jgi:hypothetical protein
MLQPGDVMITRHDDAMSNLFLPGFWPHAALHVGLPDTRERLALEIDAERAGRWSGARRVLEARKDGLLLRDLDDTLNVDSVAVVRPRLQSAHLRAAIQRALSHEGKLYDFEFDFSRSDRMVCSEVVYRAFDGLGPIRFVLTRRAARLTLSAEDILEMAVSGNGFEPVAVFGVPGLHDRLVTGPEVTSILQRSYVPSGS